VRLNNWVRPAVLHRPDRRLAAGSVRWDGTV